MRCLYLSLLCLLSLPTFAQQGAIAMIESGTAKGISFEEKPFEELLTQARKENKIIFIDAYTTWCGPCKLMAKNIFPLPEVGAVYNERFINAKIDMEKGEGPSLSDRYGVMAYPSYLFVDGSGDIVHKGLGSMPADKFLELADAASGNNSLGSLGKRYDGGERDAEFLLNYYEVLTELYEKDKAAMVSGVYLGMLDDWSGEETLKMLIANPGPLGGKRMTYLIDNADNAIVIGGSSFVSNMEKALVGQYMSDNKAKELPTLEEVGVFYKENASGMYRLLIDHYPLFLAEQNRDRDGYLAGLLGYFSKHESNDPYELNGNAWTVFESSDNQDDLRTALGWAKKSVGIEASYPNMDTLAWLYHKTGNKKMAREIARQAIQMAKDTGQNYADTKKILEEK